MMARERTTRGITSSHAFQRSKKSCAFQKGENPLAPDLISTWGAFRLKI